MRQLIEWLSDSLYVILAGMALTALAVVQIVLAITASGGFAN